MLFLFSFFHYFFNGQPLFDNEEFPPMNFIVKVEVYAENTTPAASYPIELEWTGKAFNTLTERIIADRHRIINLEKYLHKNKADKTIKLLKSKFFKK